EPPVEPFSKDEVSALLKACEDVKTADTADRRRFCVRANAIELCVGVNDRYNTRARCRREQPDTGAGR
ncbi:MAG TPA: hypothetical protein VJ754_08485, partial [Anaerolineae bacterium]|nr:hypothetical protein [Anaerolineae bacterium]